MNENPVGILVVDKPEGWTSNDVVQKTKHMIKAKKVGHTGTLDPMATGVLILLIGKATKTAHLYADDYKRYQAEITFGSSTDSYDRTGAVTEEGSPDSVDLEKLKEVIESFKGPQEQLPPMYSAVKVKGKKLYELARKGKVVERKARSIIIESIEADLSAFPVITIDVLCSKGTYIRSIAHDIGDRVACPSHLSGLVRTAAGRYTIENAVDFSGTVDAGDALNLLNNIIPLEVQS